MHFIQFNFTLNSLAIQEYFELSTKIYCRKIGTYPSFTAVPLLENKTALYSAYTESKNVYTMWTLCAHCVQILIFSVSSNVFLVNFRQKHNIIFINK